jgi:hypothetical protein
MKNLFTLLFALFTIITGTNAQTYSWAYSTGGSGWEDARSAHLGADNGMVVTGMFSNTVQFGATTLTSAAYQDVFVAKYDQLGNVLWAKAISGATEQDWGYKITTNNTNDVFITGYFQSNVLKFTPTDSLVRNTLGFRDAFVACYSSTGVFQWAKSIKGITTNAYITAYSIATDNANNVIVSGQYTKQIEISGTVLPTAGFAQANMFMAKYDASGTLIWAKAGLSSAQCWFADMVCDASNNIYATGKISKKITFGAISSPQVSGDQLILAKFDASGNALWMQLEGDSLSASITENSFDCGTSIAIDASGNVIVGGSILDTSYIDTNNNNVLVLSQSAMVAKYTSNGVKLWMKNFGTSTSNVVNDIDLDINGDIYAIGNYKNGLNVGGVNLPVDTNIGSFVAKFNNATGATDFAYENGMCDTASTGYGIGVNLLNGNVYTAGNYRGANTFTNTLNSAGSYDIYLTLLNNSVYPLNVAQIAKQADIKVYPNPATDLIKLHAQEGIITDETMVYIYNILGVVEYVSKMPKNKILSVTQLSKGLYNMVLITGAKRDVIKFVKQ